MYETKAREDYTTFCVLNTLVMIWVYPEPSTALQQNLFSFKKEKCQQMVLWRLLEGQREQETKFPKKPFVSEMTGLVHPGRTQQLCSTYKCHIFANVVRLLRYLGEICLLDLLITVLLFGHIASASFILKKCSCCISSAHGSQADKKYLYFIGHVTPIWSATASFLFRPFNLLLFLFCFACCLCIQKVE